MKERYVIKGKDKFGSIDIYGKFDTLRECLTYLNTLKSGCMGTTVKFWFVEI